MSEQMQNTFQNTNISINVGKELNVGDIVEVYRNLHKGLNFSIRNKTDKIVVAIGDGFIISNIKTTIRTGGRQRVINESRKNVHAFLTGEYMGACELNTDDLEMVYYNPYKLDRFILKASNRELQNGSSVYFKDGQAWLIKGEDKI